MGMLKEDFAKIVHLAHRGVMSQDEIALVVRVEEEINANGTAGADDIEYVCSLAPQVETAYSPSYGSR